MPITNSNSFFEINVIDYFPVYGGDTLGITDCTTSFQQAIIDAQSQKNSRIYVPLAEGQKYLITQDLIISSDIYFYGDTSYGFTNNINNNFSGIIANNSFLSDSLFLIEDIVHDAAIVFEGINFINLATASPLNYLFKFKSHIDNHPKYFSFKQNTCEGFSIAFRFECDNLYPKWNVSAENILIEDNIFKNCNLLIDADYSVINIDIVNNTIPSNAKIRGRICGILNIQENNLKGNSNFLKNIPVDVATSVNINFDRNDIENNSGLYTLNIKGASNNIINIGNQLSQDLNSALDIYLIEGRVKINLNKEFQATNYQTVGTWNNKRSPIILNPNNDVFYDQTIGYSNPSIAIVMPGTNLRSNGFYYNPISPLVTANFSYYAAAWLNYRNYYNYLPVASNGEMITAGTDQFPTPLGYCNTGLKVITNQSPILNFNNLNYVYSPNSTCVIVVCSFIKFTGIAFNETLTPTLQLIDSFGNLIQEIAGCEIDISNNDSWFLHTGVSNKNIPIHPQSNLKIRFILNSSLQNNSNAKLLIAGVGAYIVPNSDKVIINNDERDFIQPFVPFN